MRKKSQLFQEGILTLSALGLWGLYCLYDATVRKTVVNPQYTLRELPPGRNVIYVFWHSKTFTSLPFARHCQVPGYAVLTLPDWKNQIYDRICRFFGYQTVPVRSSSAAAGRLKEFLERGFHVGIALDGPKGPVGIIKPGALYLASKTGKPLVAVNVKADRSWRIHSRWDRFEIPLPFTRVIGTLSEPIPVEEGHWEEALERIRAALPDL